MTEYDVIEADRILNKAVSAIIGSVWRTGEVHPTLNVHINEVQKDYDIKRFLYYRLTPYSEFRKTRRKYQ